MEDHRREPEAEPPPSAADAETPRESKPWELFRDMARELVPRLEEAALIKSKPGPAVDTTGARRAREIAAELTYLGDRFDSWPTADVEIVALERGPLPARLMTLNREALELLAGIPKTYPPR